MILRKTRRAAAALLVAALGAVTLAACKENPTATEACKLDAKMSFQCRDCCHSNGADGWSFFDEKCVCRN